MRLSDIVVSVLAPIAGEFHFGGSLFSVSSLGCALVVGATALALRRRRKGRALNLPALGRMLFPRKLARAPSCGADFFYFFFNVIAFGALFGWAILSAHWINGLIVEGLTAAFGARAPAAAPALFVAALQTLVLFLAYELGYWIDHWTSHRFPVLWEFHKVHHTAELLTPLTVWRVHPVEMIKFSNILAVVVATANGALTWGFGDKPHPFVIDGRNLLLVVFIHAYLHLQHSNIWISFGGVWGRVFMSPAHHQIHHSMDARHFNCNLGSCLCVFDTLFGTLYAPARDPEKLRYGVEGEGAAAHTPTGFMLTPVRRALAMLAPGVKDRAGVAPASR